MFSANPLLGFRFMEVFLEVLEEYLGEVRSPSSSLPNSPSLRSAQLTPPPFLVSQVSESTLKDNFDIVYQVGLSSLERQRLATSSNQAHASLPPFLSFLQLLEEMLDEGSPLTTQSNILRDIVLPPSLLNKVLSVAGVSGFVE